MISKRARWITCLVALMTSNVTLAADELRKSLDSMQKMLTGEEQFDGQFYDEIIECLQQLDPNLLDSVNAQFKGFRTYAKNGGNPPEDIWHTCNERGYWFETNCTIQEYGEIPIWEPCNYASNVAYFKTTIEICKHKDWAFPQETVNALGKVFASLVLGSAFWHGSRTKTGGIADEKLNDLFTYVLYQETVSYLKTDNESIIHDLSYQPRILSAKQITDVLMKSYIEIPVDKWGTVLKDTSIPTVYEGMCAFFMGTFTFLFEDELVDQLANLILTAFGNSENIEALRGFCLNDYTTEFRRAISELKPLRQDKRTKLMRNAMGTITKLLYAFLWQEQYFLESEIFLKPMINEVGAALLPLINELSTLLNTYKYSSPFLQLGQNFYPGEAWCNAWDPHAKWHLETSIALVDFVFLGDQIYSIIADNTNQNTL